MSCGAFPLPRFAVVDDSLLLTILAAALCMRFSCFLFTFSSMGVYDSAWPTPRDSFSVRLA